MKATTHRLINSRFPTIGLFDDLEGLSAEDIATAFVLESMTSDRNLRAQQRMLLLPPPEVVTGDTAHQVMAAFLYTEEAGGRFHDVRLGAWYAALEVETAIAETLYHNTRRLAASDGGFPNTIQMRQLIAKVDCDLIDLRGLDASDALYNPDDYSASQAFAAKHRWNTDQTRRDNGTVFRSVRRQTGINICLWWPSLIGRPVTQGKHFQYTWDRDGRIEVVEMRSLDV